MDLRGRRDVGTTPSVLLVDFAVAWCIAVAVRRSLFAAITGSLWPFPPLPWFERVGLAALGFVAGAPGVLLVAIGLRIFLAAPRFPGALAAGLKVAGLAVAFAVELFVFLSWGTYYDTHEFLNAELLALFVRSPCRCSITSRRSRRRRSCWCRSPRRRPSPSRGMRAAGSIAGRLVAPAFWCGRWA